MPGKAATPKQIADVVAYREAGFTVTMIADRTGLSFSTVNRIIAGNRVRKGAARQAVVEDARREVRSLLREKDAIASEAARLIADDLAHARLLRERLAIASEHVNASNLDEAAIAMRAMAAMSTALKNTSDMVRHSLDYGRLREEVDDEDLAILQVVEGDDEQIRAMLAAQSANDEGRQEGKDEPIATQS